MSVLWAVGIFFSPSSAVRALFFSSYLKERGTSFSPSSVRHVEKIEHFQARKRTNFFFRRGNDTRHDLFLSLSLVPPLWRSHSHTIDIDYLIGRVTTQCEDLSRCSSEDDDHHHRRDRQRRERVRERGKEERKKNIRKRRERRRGPKTRESDTFSSLSWNFSKRLNENVPRA